MGSLNDSVENRTAVFACHNPPSGVLTSAWPDVHIHHFDLPERVNVDEGLAEQPVPSDARWRSSIFHRVTRSLETLPLPIIVDTCMGTGYKMTLACDIRQRPASENR